MENVIKILKYAMYMEEEGKRFYTGAAERARIKKTKDLFLELAEMEEMHSNFIAKQIKSLENKDGWDPYDYNINEREHKFKESIDNSPIKEDLEGSLSDMAALRMAYLIENDFAEFYKNAAEDEKNSDGKNIFKMLSSWEEGHRDTLLEEYQRMIKENWFDQGFSPF